MPILLEANSDFEVVLECDKDKENPPKFIFKALSCRDWRTIAKIADEIYDGSADDMLDKIFKMLGTGLAGWTLTGKDGQALAFEPEKLQDYLTIKEAMELLEKFKAQGVGAAERKN